MSTTIVNCDWGTTRLRVRAVRVDRQQVTAEYRSLEGVATIAGEFSPADRPAVYRSLLAEALQPLSQDQPEMLADAPILISGMASSSLGWQELPYARLPLELDGRNTVWRQLESLTTTAGTHAVLLLSGVSSSADVLRGEETELIGLFALPAFQTHAAASLVIKPGTHSKHLQVRQGRMVAFRTFMTGELFDVLSRHSLLSHSVAQSSQDATEDQPVDLAALQAGVRQGVELPLSAALFRVRTRHLLDGQATSANRDFLTGVLLGAELGYLTAHDAEGPLILAASQPLSAVYRAAFDELALTPRAIFLPAEQTELLSAIGQIRIWSTLRETGQITWP